MSATETRGPGRTLHRGDAFPRDSRPESGRIGQLDGLRAVACLAVMGFHAQLPGFSHGWLGVDVFFVLSGFLTARQLGSGQSTVVWLYRRWARLHPALLFLVLVWGPVAVAGGVGLGTVTGMALFTYLPWWTGGEGGLLGHTWSLTVEVAAYVLAAAVLPWLQRVMPRRALAVGLAAAAIACWLSDWLPLRLARPEGILLGLALGTWPAVSASPWLTRITRPLAEPILVALGRRTYSLYLWHLPVMSVLRFHTPLNGIALWTAQFGLSLMAAELSFHLVEGPARRGLYRSWPERRRPPEFRQPDEKGETRPVHIVVVAYGAPEVLDAALRTLGGAVKVTVVDNSSDAAVAAVAVRHGARYDDPGYNLGFAGGVNRALRPLLAGPPSDVLLLNPDAELDAADLVILQERLHAAADIGAISPVLLGPDATRQRESWPFPGPTTAWLQALGLSWFANRSQFVVGAVLLLRWEALQEVGLFDERFFLYAEETDWQRRAHLVGWRADVCPQVVASHLGAGTSTDAWRREVLFHAGSEIYIRKWFGAWGWMAYRAGVLAGCLIRILVSTERRSASVARARIYWHGPSRLAAAARST